MYMYYIMNGEMGPASFCLVLCLGPNALELAPVRNSIS